MNRRLFLDRWDATAPRDDSAIWVGRGFDVVDHVVRTVVGEDRRLCARAGAGALARPWSPSTRRGCGGR